MPKKKPETPRCVHCNQTPEEKGNEPCPTTDGYCEFSRTPEPKQETD